MIVDGIVTTYDLRIFTADPTLIAAIAKLTTNTDQVSISSTPMSDEPCCSTDDKAPVALTLDAKEEAQPEPKEDPALPTEEVVRKKLRAFSRRKGVGVAGVTSVLTSLKVERFDELTRDQYPDLLAKIA